MRRYLLIVALMVGMGAHCASAYETGTHSRLSEKAYKRSRLSTDTSLLKDVGLETAAIDLGRQYFDVSGDQIVVRQVRSQAFETGNDRLTNIGEAQYFHPIGWLSRGTILEDNVLGVFGFIGRSYPEDDPDPTRLNRVCRHFYDPYNNRGLTVSPITIPLCGIGGNERAPDWALGTTNAFATPPYPNYAERSNHFTVLDARQAMYYALTGTGDPTGGTVPVLQETRNAWWATTFRALGDVIHLVQDMAQPQHTRNEAHPIDALGDFYESYIDAKLSRRLE